MSIDLVLTGVCIITITMRLHVSCVYESCTIFGRKTMIQPFFGPDVTVYSAINHVGAPAKVYSPGITPNLPIRPCRLFLKL